MAHWIKNFNDLVTNPYAEKERENRKLILEIAEAGLNSINTENVISRAIKLENNLLSVGGEDFDLSKFKKIKIIGFGKASIQAGIALEKILGEKINQGIIIGLKKGDCQYIETFAGTHPRPSEVNIEAGKKIYELAKESTEEDLIIVLVSGGGSALLCYPEKEVEQGRALYESFLKSGKTISEINTVRKHISELKGGGLAKIAYPATVIGLIFSDVPGDNFADVASGPTYKDLTTREDAQKIIDQYNLGDFELNETPKEDKYFEKVHNFVLVSNKTAVEAMSKKVEELNLEANIISTELYDETTKALSKIFEAKKDNSVVLAAGEPMLEVNKKGGTGGRNLYMAMKAMKIIQENSVFISLASDGMDNSDIAGAIVDRNTFENSNKLKINIDDQIDRFDAIPVFEKNGDAIITGPTGANVSDLMILLTKR